MRGFEPPTSGSTDRRSNQLSYIHRKLILYYTNFPGCLQNARRKLRSGFLRRAFSARRPLPPPSAFSGLFSEPIPFTWLFRRRRPLFHFCGQLFRGNGCGGKRAQRILKSQRFNMLHLRLVQHSVRC